MNDPHEFLRTLALVMGVAAAAMIILSGIYDLIPGLGQPVSVEVGPVDFAVG